MKSRAYGAKWFYDEFKSRITWEKYAVAYKADADFTPLVTNEIKEIIRTSGLRPQTEYFRIDVIGYESRWKEVRESARSAEMGAYLWDLKIAVEHENSKSDWSDEVVKLMQIRCPLKVIVGYNYYDERGEAEQRKLDFASELIRNVAAYSSALHDREEILIILGNGQSKKGKASDYSDFDYRGYLYDYERERFELMV